MASPPVLFTVEFRRKMAGLSPRQRQDWLASLASTPGGDRRRRTLPRARSCGEVARGCRLSLVESLARRLGPFDERHLRAILEVPRERFVRAEDVGQQRRRHAAPTRLDRAGDDQRPPRLSPLVPAPGPRTGRRAGRARHGLRLRRGPRGVHRRARAGASSPSRSTPSSPARSRRDPGRRAERDVRRGRRRDELGARGVAPRAWWRPSRSTPGRAPGSTRSPRAGGWWRRWASDEQRLVLAERRGGKILETDHGAVRYVRNRSAR